MVLSIEDFLGGDLDLDALRGLLYFSSYDVLTNGAVLVVMNDLRLLPMPIPYSFGRVERGNADACQFSPLLAGG